jgi:hypothetical protein
MNKIYNNLNIENLSKTEWFNQFDKEQQNEVLKGLEKNLDISKYANSEIDYEEMNEIRKELLKGKLNGEQNNI